jgi:hypothetical protein
MTLVVPKKLPEGAQEGTEFEKTPQPRGGDRIQVLKGHDFGRAGESGKSERALAPEGRILTREGKNEWHKTSVR